MNKIEKELVNNLKNEANEYFWGAVCMLPGSLLSVIAFTGLTWVIFNPNMHITSIIGYIVYIVSIIGTIFSILFYHALIGEVKEIVETLKLYK